MTKTQFLAVLSIINRKGINDMPSEEINQTEKIPIYTFGTISFKDLEHLVSLKRNLETSVFNNWFEAEIQISQYDTVFFEGLIRENDFLISFFRKIISPPQQIASLGRETICEVIYLNIYREL